VSAAPTADASSPGAPRLSMRGIVKRFGGVTALAGAELEARGGEILGLAGENGAGKSTLLKILAGAHPRGTFDGDITLDGQPLSLRSTADARRAGISIVHQELMLVPELTVAQNLFLGREPRAFALLDGDTEEFRARELLARFGAQGIDARAQVATLGIGAQQVVEIVRALASHQSGETRVLILDEPTAALSEDERVRLFAWLRRLRAGGTTCIYVSHRMDEVLALCDRVTVLRDGRTAGTVELPPRSDSPSTASEARTICGAEIVRLMVGRDVTERERPQAPPRATPPLFEARQLTVAGALDAVSLEVHAGELVAIAGAMGSGRTALLTTIFGCARARARGELILDGKPIAPSSPRAAIAAGLALVPEDRKAQGLVLSLSIADNLALPLALADDAEAELIARARIDELRIRGQARAEVATLSGGNQQKVALGKWLQRPPRLLLLDEPTRGVDLGAREEIYGLIHALLARGVGVLMASSDLAEVQRLAHRIIVLRKGRVAGELPAGAAQHEIVALSTGIEAASA
jgi:ribose transport system ATP-binding protein